MKRIDKERKAAPFELTDIGDISEVKTRAIEAQNYDFFGTSYNASKKSFNYYKTN